MLLADRYSYLATMALVPAASCAVHRALQRLHRVDGASGKIGEGEGGGSGHGRRGRDRRRALLLVLTCSALIGALAVQTHVTNRKWITADSLWRHAIHTNPHNHLAFANLKGVLAELDQAEPRAPSDVSATAISQEQQRELLRAAWAASTYAYVHNPAYTRDHASIAKAYEASGRMLLNSGLQIEAKQVRRKGRCGRGCPAGTLN